MEFKGTKGKWYSEYKSGYWKITDDEREGSIADVYFFNDEKDTAEHNAKIIEKAPEMLEMLHEIERRYYVIATETETTLREKMIGNLTDGISELIKEATEL